MTRNAANDRIPDLNFDLSARILYAIMNDVRGAIACAAVLRDVYCHQFRKSDLKRRPVDKGPTPPVLQIVPFINSVPAVTAKAVPLTRILCVPMGVLLYDASE